MDVASKKLAYTDGNEFTVASTCSSRVSMSVIDQTVQKNEERCGLQRTGFTGNTFEMYIVTVTLIFTPSSSFIHSPPSDRLGNQQFLRAGQSNIPVDALNR